MQSPLSRTGGVWSQLDAQYYKEVRVIKQNIIYQQVYVNRCPIHVFTVYIPPYKTANERKVLNYLVWMVSGILRKFLNSKIVIMGDFNSYIKDLGEEMQKYNIHQVIPDAIPTHNSGRNIDNFFTNIPVLGYGVDDILSVSDHRPIWIKLSIDIGAADLDMKNPPTFHTQNDVRKALKEEEIKEKLREHDFEHGGAVLDMVRDQLPLRRMVKTWYE